MRSLVLAGLLAFGAASAHAQQPPVEAFARLPAMVEPVLSPDGRRLAYIANDGDASALYILDIDSGDRRGIGTSEIRPHALRWAGNGHVLMMASTADRFTRFDRRNPVDRSAVFAVDAASPASVIQLLHDDRQIHPQNLNLGNVVGVDQSTGDVMIPAYEAPRQAGVSSSRGSDAIQRPRNTLWRVDPADGNVSREMQGLPEVFNWFVDQSGNAIGREYYDNERDTYRFFAYRDGDWQVVMEENDPVLSSEIVGFYNATEAALYRYNGNYAGLRTVSIASGPTADVTALPDRDILGWEINPYTNYIIGIEYDEDGMRTAWFDDGLQSMQTALANALGDDSTTISSWSQDQSRIVVRTDNGDAAPSYYLYDNNERSLSPLASEYPELAEAALGNRIARTFTARDGTEIPGFVTMPPGGGTNLPAVVLPHGGPESEDVGGFDYWAHFLASRGYVVIQPNFRGSTGHGLAHRDSGRGEWGVGVTQTDVIDALGNLVDEGVVDGDRACIVGASYGGYSALAAGAFQPDTFACIAAYAPLANLGLFLGDSEMAYGGNSFVAAYWRRVFGGDISADERRRLDDISPFYNAANFRAPVLLMHGRDDSVVPISQSRRMEDALDDAGKDVTYIEMRGADHWLTSRQTRLDVLGALESFLAEHIGD